MLQTDLRVLTESSYLREVAGALRSVSEWKSLQ